MDLFRIISDFIYQMGTYERIMAGVLMSVFLLALVLRVALYVGYSGGVLLIKHNSKSIRSKDDVARMLGTPFALAAKEYLAMMEKSGRADAHEVARHALFYNRLLFFNFNSMGHFIRALESGFLILAILFALAASAGMQFVMIAAGIFFLIQISAAIFDVKTARQGYVSTLAMALNRDIGRLFPTEASEAIYAFGSDLKEYLGRQSAMFTDVLVKINSELTGSIKNSISAMTTSVEATMKAISKQEGLETSVAKWTDATNAATGHMAAYARVMEEGTAGLMKNAALLTDAVGHISAVNSNSDLRNGTFQQQLDLVREGQKALARSVEQYEISLKDITSQMGDALGKIVNYHLSGVGTGIADSISDSLRQVVAGNMEQIERMHGILEELFEQSRYQTKLLMNFKGNPEDDYGEL